MTASCVAGVFTFQHREPARPRLDVHVDGAQPCTRSVVVPAEGNAEPPRIDVR